MTTPARPRQSGIPGPGRVTGIPTPGRSRSSSIVHQYIPPAPVDDISRAFADAIKANDPSQHRNVPPSSNPSTSSLSPQSVAYSLSSGRRSVTGRPSSSASTSSIKVPERAKTPTSARTSSRPHSRQSDVANRPARAFEVGDNVRIESLGFEGALRFVGEIDGKPGLWAGIELSGGFAGRGKNNGTVAGIQYFHCPDKCGVFVATTKLSAPTVGPGAIQRPSSVASSRGGRTTPANSGRTTPSFFSASRTPSASFSNGRVTPLTGNRITPSSTSGRVTPGNIPAGRRPFKTPTSKPNGISLSEKITAGSRASKYMTMTAQQLNSRDMDGGVDSPTRNNNETNGFMISSPTISRTLSSPSRPSGSPFSTPKAGNGKSSNIGGISASPSLPLTRSRPSMNTPRARVPSAVAMPPPPSPKVLQLQQTHGPPMHENAASYLSYLEKQDRATPDTVSSTAVSTSRPGSSTSFRSAGTDELNYLGQLQSRLDAAEYENERLRAASEAETGLNHSSQLEQLQIERKCAVDKTALLEERLSLLEGDLASHIRQLEALQTENARLNMEISNAKSEIQQSTAARRQDQDMHALAVKCLQEKLDGTDRVNHEKDALIETQSLDINRLATNLDRLNAALEEERKELGAQIDELRIAGQETIALYEERLSDANSQRYELEHRISSLEAGLKSMVTDEQSRESVSRVTSSATQIDNETLRDQVQHLQKRSSKLEEQLEEARATLERDVAVYQDRIVRIRIDEEQRKRDLTVKTREVEQLLKSEANARGRVEEIEEALRESTVALENTRGEVEALRAELANLDVLIDDASEGDISSRLANFTKKASADKAKYQQEINRLEELVRQSRIENDHLLGQRSCSTAASGTLQETIDTLNVQNIGLREHIAHLQGRATELTQTLIDQTNELDILRKKLNRDAVFSNGIQDSKMVSPKSEPSTIREEVAGLKHIVQELQKENLAAAQQIKLLESENQLLSAEAEQLRQEVHILEDDMDNGLHQGNAVLETASSTINDMDGLRHQVKEQSTRFENELDHMRKRLSESEIKHARTVHDLNKEISELEALVESKIYREDELEQEVERLKEKLSRHKKSSKSASDLLDSGRRLSTASSSTASSENLVAGSRDEEVCEICERPGHDIFNCNLLKEDAGKAMVCEDCESPGHVAANCPHSQDIF